jgi:hypothetical protein
MAQTGYTPIQLYYSSTTTNVPLAADLSNGELAINITDGKLFYKDNANAIQVIGWKTTPTSAGGTGLTSYTAGDMIYYVSGTALSKLAIGASGRYLSSSGSAPQWSAPAALTKTDDTNVTLTLGGSASTSLLNAASLTLGWTGTLATSRGGTGLSSFTANGVVYASSSSALTTGTALVFDGTNFGIGGGIAVTKLAVSFNGNTENGSIFRTTTNASGAVFAYFQESTNVCGFIARVGTTSAVTYSTVSDYRLKTVVGAVTGHGERIDALKPIDYQWKEGGQQARGFLAHEFQEVYESSVFGVKDAVDVDGNPKYQAMQAGSSEVIADLVAEIQSLRKRLAALETKCL